MNRLRFEIINAEKVHPNTWNSNFMIENELQSLQKELTSVGVLKPIIVWEKTPGYFEIIDGEQRFTILKNNGIMEIACNVWEDAEINRIKADIEKFTGQPCTEHLLLERFKIITHNLNEIKGTPSITTLAEHYKNTDVKALYDRYLKFNMAKLREAAENLTTNFDPNSALTQAGGSKDFIAYQFLIKGHDNIELVKKALDTVQATNRNDALIELCREFLKTK